MSRRAPFTIYWVFYSFVVKYLGGCTVIYVGHLSYFHMPCIQDTSIKHSSQNFTKHQSKDVFFCFFGRFWSSFWRFIQEKLPQRLDNSLAKRADFRGFGLTVILPPITGGFWPIRILQASAASTICCGLMYQCALNAKSARPHVMRPQFLLTKQLMSACKIKFKCTCLKSVFLDKSEV